MTGAGPAVERVDAGQAERAVDVLALAFASDPLLRWFFPEARDYLRHFAGFARAFGGRALASGTAFATADWSGAALWLPAGVEPDAEALGRVFEQMSPSEDLGGLAEQIAAHHIREPHWYLPMIGVDPRRQGEGVGSALLRESLAACDADRLPAYLESSSPANLPLYERHGFEVVAELQEGSSPPVWPMLRRAR